MSPHAAMSYRLCDRRYFWTNLRKAFQCLDRKAARLYSGATQHGNELEDSASSASNFSSLKSRSLKVRHHNSEAKPGFQNGAGTCIPREVTKRALVMEWVPFPTSYW